MHYAIEKVHKTRILFDSELDGCLEKRKKRASDRDVHDVRLQHVQNMTFIVLTLKYSSIYLHGRKKRIET